MPTAIHQTHNQHGAALREDVLDVIFQITPDDTPFYMDIGDATASSTRHYWTTRSLSVRNANAVPEGDSFAGNYSGLSLPTRVGNICQILRKLPQVTGSMGAEDTIGVQDLMADQISLRMVEWKTDAEHALLRGSVRTGTTHVSDSRYMGGLHNIVSTNAFDYGSVNSFAEAKFIDLLEAVWSSGGNPKKVLCGSKVKRTIGTFTASSTKFLETQSNTVTNVVNVYESDFGVTNIRISRDVPSAAGTFACYAYDPDFFDKAWLRRPFVERIARTGDSEEAVILGELTLEYGNEAAAGALTDLQVSGS